MMKQIEPIGVKPKGFSTWNKYKTIVKKLEQDFKVNLEPIITLTPINNEKKDATIFGESNRWQTVLPIGAIVKLKNEEKISYAGDGKFYSSKSPEKALSLTALAEESMCKKGTKSRLSGPQSAMVVLQHLNMELAVPVKLFDYILGMGALVPSGTP